MAFALAVIVCCHISKIEKCIRTFILPGGFKAALKISLLPTVKDAHAPSYHSGGPITSAESYLLKTGRDKS